MSERDDMARSRNLPVGPKRRPIPLAPDHLRRINQLEALPENASGAEKSWVHKAHADAMRHLRSAKRR